MDNYGVTQLYRRIISPSVKVQNEEWQKQTHYRHTNYKSQSPVNRLKMASPVHSVVSAPGHLEARDLSLQPLSGNNSVESEKSSTRSEYARYSFQPTVKFKTTSLPSMPLSRKYSPSPIGTTRSVPISYSNHMGVPSRFWTNENPRILYSRQRDRLKAEEQAKEHCRKLKRTSEILHHRVDKQYYMAGNKIPLQGRYDVDNTDLLTLRLLAEQKQLVNYNEAKNANFPSSNPRDSPGGQLTSPVPGSGTREASSAAFSSATDFESPDHDGKWAEEESDASSVDEFDSVSNKGTRRQDFEARKALALEERKSQQESDSVKGRLTKSASDGESKKTHAVKAKTSSSAKGVKKGKIRFKDGGKSPDDQKPGTERKKMAKKGKEVETNEDKKEDESDVSEPKEEKRNKYLDEWLGIKREEEDPRYRPGKPPPNRIFMSANTGSTKKGTRKFSSTFLTEITEAKAWEDEEFLTPDARYGIINDQQKHVFGLLFDEVDKDKNGSVTLQELKLRMQPAVSRHDIKHFVQVFDLNKDETIDKREFTAICALNDRIAGIKTESEDASLSLDLENLAQHIVIFKEMFKTIDEDDDNRLDAGELLVMVSAAMETEIGADLQTAKEVLEGARDEFGFIDFIGFMSYIPFFAKLIRTILDHPLTISELERARERVKQHDLTFKPKKKAKEPKSWEVF
ncbi:uncharacterized protein LOC110062130 [Orbicella faveolata]|uniref:uncharacterized protein LOC110062130 n=1 Tax=Orbicella faveolata TaxID=48498 RepID=UPI0009E45B4A|nr:uncharacterized protein LOC110062130 [Orbicella faveolata]